MQCLVNMGKKLSKYLAEYSQYMFDAKYLSQKSTKIQDLRIKINQEYDVKFIRDFNYHCYFIDNYKNMWLNEKYDTLLLVAQGLDVGDKYPKGLFKLTPADARIWLRGVSMASERIVENNYSRKNEFTYDVEKVERARKHMPLYMRLGEIYITPHGVIRKIDDGKKR